METMGPRALSYTRSWRSPRIVQPVMADDPKSLRVTGWIQLFGGAFLTLIGIAGIVSMALGFLPFQTRTTFFPVVAFLIGSGIVGLGWSTLRDASFVEREAARRRARRDSRPRPGLRDRSVYR